MIDGLDQGIGLGMKRKVGKLVESLGERSAIDLFLFGHAEDFAMVGALEIDAVFQKVFTQFFAGAHASGLNIDIAIRFKTRKSDEVFGKVENSNLFAHIKHEDLAAPAHGRSLQNEVHRFGNDHEITIH